jgi:hypothetical protein
MKRREILVGCGTFLAGVATGRLVDFDIPFQSQQSPGTPTPADTQTATPMTVTLEATDTPSETPTPTETPIETSTDTPTPTPTFTPDGIVHSLDEQFTVGEGNRAITYRIVDFYRADELGSEVSKATAEGAYLVVVVEITNPRNSRIVLPRDDFRLRSYGLNDWFKFAETGSEKVENDDRIDAAELATVSLSGGETVTGAIAFDVELDADYWIWITPDGGEDTPEHFVEIGDIADVEPL